MSEHKIPIPSRIYNAAVDGHVAGADQIIDDKTGLTLDKVAGGALEEKEHISSSNNGMGRVVLRKNIVSGVNTLTQSMINKSNTIYVIQYDFTLGKDITIPENCILEFEGGSISGNYTIDCNHCRLDGSVKFKNGIHITGKPSNPEYWVNWWDDLDVGIHRLIDATTYTDLGTENYKVIKWYGKIDLTSPIIVPINSYLEGVNDSGKNYNSTIFAPDTYNFDYMVSFEGGNDWNFRNGIKDCWLAVSNNATINEAIIHINKAYETLIDNVRIDGKRITNGINVSNITSIEIRDCIIKNVKNGIVQTESFGGVLRINNNDIEECTHAIENTAGNMIINNCYFERNIFHIYLTNSTDFYVKVKDCVFNASNANNGICSLQGYNAHFKDCIYITSFGNEYKVTSSNNTNIIENCNFTSLVVNKYDESQGAPFNRDKEYSAHLAKGLYKMTFNKSEIVADTYYNIATISFSHYDSIPITLEATFGTFGKVYNKFTFDTSKNFIYYNKSVALFNVRNAEYIEDTIYNYSLNFTLAAVLYNNKVYILVKPTMTGGLLDTADFVLRLQAHCIRDTTAVIFGQDDTAVTVDSTTDLLKGNIRNHGTTANRPQCHLLTGFEYFDETLHKPIYWSGDTSLGDNGWVDMLGNHPGTTTYPKVLGTPTTGNLVKFNNKDIEDAGITPQS